jgi:hypothetical protein
MNTSSLEFEELLRRIVREEVRAALTDMIPADAGPFLTYKKAAEQLNAWWRHPWDTRKRLTVRDVRANVELGFLRAVRFGSRPPRIALTELRWLDDWHRHTRDEKDREYREQQQAERDMRASRWKAQELRTAASARTSCNGWRC